MDKERQVTVEEGQRFADQNGLLFIETSAKTASNVEDAFANCSRIIYNQVKSGAFDFTSESSGIKLGPQFSGAPKQAEETEDTSCCQ